MRKTLRFFVLASASLLFAGCSTTDQRLGNLEGQMQNVQVLDLRMSNAEERLTKVEGELSGMRGAPPPAKAGSGKKGTGKTDEKSYALQSPPATGRTPAPASQSVAVSPQPGPVSQAAASPRPVSRPAPTPAPILGVPQPPYVSTHTDGRKIEPKGAPAAVAPVAAASPTPAPASPATGTPPAPALVPVGLGESSSAAPKAAPTKTATPEKSPRPVAEKAPAAPEKTGTGAYDAALALYYKGQYGKAQEQFDGFLRGHPSSSLAPNAMYWQGECLYSQNKFDSAIIIFKDLAGKYPKHPKAAAALLKAGFAYARIKDMENARFYWQILVDDFPKSEPATIARKRLAQG